MFENIMWLICHSMTRSSPGYDYIESEKKDKTDNFVKQKIV